MAKRKKAVKRSTRRRRVGAIGGDGVKVILGAVVGSVAANLVASKLPATLDDKIKGAIIAVAGFFVAKQSSPMIKGLGIGMAASGGVTLAKAVLPAGTLGAIGYDWDRLSGFNSYPNNPQLNAIAGFNVNPNNPQTNVIAGIDSRAGAGAGIC